MQTQNVKTAAAESFGRSGTDSKSRLACVVPCCSILVTGKSICELWRWRDAALWIFYFKLLKYIQIPHCLEIRGYPKRENNAITFDGVTRTFTQPVKRSVPTGCAVKRLPCLPAPTEIYEYAFNDALGLMYPMNRCCSKEGETFMLQEMVCGNVTEIYARIGITGCLTTATLGSWTFFHVSKRS